MTSRTLPTHCPHCQTSIVLSAPHCPHHDGTPHPTCTWTRCPCRAVIDPAGRLTHPDHTPHSSCSK